MLIQQEPRRNRILKLQQVREQQELHRNHICTFLGGDLGSHHQMRRIRMSRRQVPHHIRNPMRQPERHTEKLQPREPRRNRMLKLQQVREQQEQQQKPNHIYTCLGGDLGSHRQIRIRQIRIRLLQEQHRKRMD